jgi:vacuolar-type H+-ATPase subunit H
MAKAEKVVATGLSEKSKIYTVKNKEEELRKVLDEAREEARQVEEQARTESDQIEIESRDEISEIEKKAFESIAKSADGSVKEIQGSKETRINAYNKSAGSNKEKAIKAGLNFLVNE